MNTLVIHDRGTSSVINDDGALQLVSDFLSANLSEIDDTIKVILSADKVKHLISQNQGIEICYQEPVSLRINANKKSVTFSRIYIPLTGTYSEYGLVLFLGEASGYGANPPYVIYNRLAELKIIVEKIRSGSTE